MHLHSPRDHDLKNKLNDLENVVRCRKRKLSELLTVTGALSPQNEVPRNLRQDDSNDQALALFLEQNDIERGRYFDESTLPPTPPFDWASPFSPPHNDSITQDSQASSKSSLRVNTPSASASRGSRGHTPAADDETKPLGTRRSSKFAQSQGLRSSEDRSPIGQDATSATGDDEDVDVAAMPTPRSVGIADEEQSLRQHDTLTVPKSQRPTLDRTSAPQSPPYSPGSHQAKGPPSPQRSAHQGRDSRPPVSPSTAVDDSDDSRLRPQSSGSAEDASKSHEIPSNLSRDADAAKLRQTRLQDVWGERRQSPSSTSGARSTDLSRPEGRSPARSPENDTVMTQPRTARERSIAQDEKASKQRSRKSSPAASTATPKASRLETPRQQDGERKQGSGPLATSASAGNKNSQAPIRQSTTQDVNMKDVELARAASASTAADQPSQLSLSPSKRLADMLDSANKRRKSSETSFTAIVTKTTLEERKSAMSKALQPPAGPSNGHASILKKDYMYPLFLKQAMELPQTYKTELAALLSSSAKTLATTDWQSSLVEKQECAVIKRIYDWQQNNRWSLRRIKPHPTPATPPTHQDYLLSEMTWLAADFREERKSKTYSCQQLAQWCQEWHSSGIAQRAALQVKESLPITKFGLETTSKAQSQPQADENHQVELDLEEDDSDEEAEDVRPLFLAATQKIVTKVRINESLAKNLPMFEPWKMQDSPPVPDGLTMPPSFEKSDEGKPATQLPPEDTTCALFSPEWKGLRARSNMQWAFKPPKDPMPPISFYENRRPSHWTQEDEMTLKQFAKETPGNWALISDNLSSKSMFTSAPMRRTPWECYERLITMDGAAADPNNRQYAKQFLGHLEKIRTRWLHNAQQQIQQQAQATGQAPQNVNLRFPSPLKVERKPTMRRFYALADAARKLARKRETAENNRRQSNHERKCSISSTASHHRTRHTKNHAPDSIQPQRPAPERKDVPSYTPQKWSAIKYEQQLQINQKHEEMRRRQRAFLQQQAQQRAQQGNQTLYQSGIAQRMAGRDGTVKAPQANGHLAVPGAANANLHAQQQAMQLGLANGALPSNQMAQMAYGANMMQSQQGVPSQMQGSPQMNDQSLQQLMQQAQARGGANFAGQRQVSQGQFGRGSTNMQNGVQNAGLPAHLQRQVNGSLDAAQSPRLSSANQRAGFGSPDLAQAKMVPGSAQLQGQGRQTQPQPLSSGHTPAVSVIQHQIRQQHPGLGPEELQQRTSEQLKTMMEQSTFERSRQNALNAATGYHGHVQQQQNAAGSQSPYQQQAQINHQGPYMSNGVPVPPMGSASGRSESPANPMAQQSRYNQQMRHQLTQQMNTMNQQQNGMMSPNSPALSMAGVAQTGQPNRTPTPSQFNPNMRPPSALGAEQRPGSANVMGTPGLASQSPRPLSSHGTQ